MLKHSHRILILLLLLLAACGPAAATNPADSAIAEVAPTTTGIESALSDAESTAVATPPPSEATTDQPHIQPQLDSITYNTQGIEVGFTVEGRPYIGNPAAPIIIEEYSDYQCPFCARFVAQTMPSLLQNQIMAGQVALVFYDFPLSNIHPQAEAAANAARCAGEQGATAYWQMHDALFANTGEWSNGQAQDVFNQYATSLGLEMTQFSDCVQNGRYLEQIRTDLSIGQTRHIRSTPSFLLNNQMLVGAQPLDVFNSAIAAIQSGNDIAVAPDPTPVPAQPGIAPTPATILYEDMAISLGDATAAVTIVEYTDYQCPYCARHVSETLPQILSDLINTGRIRYIVKDFPLENIHPQARLAANAARCAGEQNAYWQMHDALFTTQGEWSGQSNDLAIQIMTQQAASLELDTAAFSTCLSNQKYDDMITANLEEGAALGVRGTPSFFINGFPVSGAQPFDLFIYAVELAETGTLADAYVQQPTPTPAPVTAVEVNIDGAYAVGNPDAPVTMVEFTDFQCPFCSRHHTQTFPLLKENFIDTGLLYYVVKDFPLTSIHPQAFQAGEAARCAGDQGAYIPMYELLFDRQSEWSGQNDAATWFKGYATELGLDTAVFATCLDNGQHETAVMSDLQYGTDLGVNGTPAFFINGYFVSGAQPYEVFAQYIESFLPTE